MSEEAESRQLKRRKRLGRRVLKAICVTVLAGVCAFFIVVPLSDSLFSKLFSAPETTDFTMSDMFMQFADSRPVRHLDDSVVVVDLGYAGRGEISDALEIIAVAEPKVVGLDVNFALPKGDGDSLLIENIVAQPQVVLPLGLEKEGDTFEITEAPFFYETLQSPNLHYGVANLPAKNSKASIREFETGFPLADGRELPSYIVEMGKLGNPAAYEKLKARGNIRETIDYASREYTVIPIDMLLDRAEELTDKYVLVGSMTDANDMHATPINSYQPGIMVHAKALSTMLEGDYFVNVPDVVDYVAAGILCFLLVFASDSIQGKGKDLSLRALQLFLLVFTIWLGYTLFLDRRTIIDLSYTFFVVGIGLFVLDFWNWIADLVAWSSERKEVRRRKNNPDNNLQSQI
ncbi:MAG: CHASE2 domain-containing protein [Muribaculaceae bacterium]|nr:CHASE2 domain-containing protein [Muribaculaceae bacterium]